MDGHELQYKCKVALSSKTNTVHHACSRVMYAMNNIIVHCYCPHIISLVFVVVNSMSYALPEVSNTSIFRTHSVVPIVSALEGPIVYMYVIPVSPHLFPEPHTVSLLWEVWYPSLHSTQDESRAVLPTPTRTSRGNACNRYNYSDTMYFLISKKLCTFSIVQTLQILMDYSEEEAKREKKQFLPIFDLQWCASFVVHGYKL